MIRVKLQHKSSPPIYKNIFPFTDHWPLGSYTMPKPKSGCPHTNNITWKESWRLQDLENDAKQRSKFSSNFNMDAKIINNDLKRGFCTIINEGVQEPWPQGKQQTFTLKRSKMESL
jgi:hypothetical protein